METPFQDQNISFKTALAVVAVHKRKSDLALKNLEQQIKALKEELQDLRVQEQHNPENILSLVSSPGDLGGSHEASFSQHDMQSQILCMQKWMAAAELVPLELHPFLARLQNHSAHKRLKERSTTLLSTPAQACIEALSGVLDAVVLAADLEGGSRGATTHPCFDSYSPQHAEIISSATTCLASLCNSPLEALTQDDYPYIQDFTARVMDTATATASCRHTPPTTASSENDSLPQPQLPPAVTTVCERIISAMQAQCSTGHIVLGCAVHAVSSSVAALAHQVMGVDDGDNAIGTLESELREQEWPGDEASLASTCIALCKILQSSLRELPTAVTSRDPGEAFMRSVVAGVKAISESCDILAPAHPEVARQGQRCAALLVSALQKVSQYEKPADFQQLDVGGPD